MPLTIRKKILLAIIACFCIGTAALAYSYFIEPNSLVVNEHEIKIEQLDTAFDGIRIAAISDIHGGSNGGSADNIHHIVETVNAKKVDLIVLLGDFVSQSQAHRHLPIEQRPIKMPVSEIAGLLGNLRSKYGVIAVLGNHDGWNDNDAIVKELRSQNISVLQNEISSIQLNGQTLRILGLKDHLQLNSWYEYDNDIRKVLAEDGRKGDIIILQHSPDIFKVIEYYKNPWEDLRLMISGHTHGGQVWLPILGRPIVPSSYGQKYAAGHITESGKDLFVTTGTGTSLLPFRFMVPPEVAVLTLRSKQDK